MKEKLNIKLTDYWYRCADGCCDDYGLIVEVNGKELEGNSQDISTVLEEVLKHLGYEVDIELDYKSNFNND